MTSLESTQQAIAYFTDEYTKARKQYKELPALEELDQEFDMLEVLGRERHFPRNPVRFTRFFLINALNGWGNYLHQFILPNAQSAVSMEEYNYFDEKEKKSIINLMNWIMLMTRSSHELQIDEDDTKTAAFISKVWADWKEYKPLLRDVIKKNADVWRKKVEG